MECDEEQIIVLCYEFWCSVGDIEVARTASRNFGQKSKFYINKCFKILLPVIYSHLFNYNSSQDESWNKTKAASCLLSIMSQCSDYSLIEDVINFVSLNLNSNEGNSTILYKREAAILAFGAILDTTHSNQMKGIVTSSVNVILAFLLENNPASLKETTAWTIEKIAELYGEIFSSDLKQLSQFYETLLNLLTISSKKVICYILNAIHFLAKNFKPQEGQNSNVLSQYMNDSLELLLKLATIKESYDTENNVAMNCFFTIGSLIENSAPDTRYIITGFFKQLINAFQDTLKPNIFESNEIRFAYQGYIASCIEACLLCGNLELNPSDASKVLELIIQTFKERELVYEEGLMAASSLAGQTVETNVEYVKLFGPYLIHGLKQIKDTSLCRTAIHSTGDLIRALGSAFDNYIDQIIPLVLEILSVIFIVILE